MIANNNKPWYFFTSKNWLPAVGYMLDISYGGHSPTTEVTVWPKYSNYSTSSDSLAMSEGSIGSIV